jgi:hypothetical protein
MVTIALQIFEKFATVLAVLVKIVLVFAGKFGSHP